MPLVQILKLREVGDKGQAILAEMTQALKDLPMPQGGVGRLHLEGKTIGDNPFPAAQREQFRAWGYKLDSLNWIYWKKYPDDEMALDEMTRLDGWRVEQGITPEASGLQFRVLQDPLFDDGWDQAEMF